MPDLKADLSEEDLLALASSGSSSDNLGISGEDEAVSAVDFQCSSQKVRLTKASKDNSDRFPENILSRFWCLGRVKRRSLKRMGQAGKVWREADSDVMILSKIVGIVYLFPHRHRESWFTRRSQSILFIVTVFIHVFWWRGLQWQCHDGIWSQYLSRVSSCVFVTMHKSGYLQKKKVSLCVFMVELRGTLKGGL